MKNRIEPALAEKIGSVKSARELIALARENGMELAEDKVQEFFDQLRQGQPGLDPS